MRRDTIDSLHIMNHLGKCEEKYLLAAIKSENLTSILWQHNTLLFELGIKILAAMRKTHYFVTFLQTRAYTYAVYVLSLS